MQTNDEGVPMEALWRGRGRGHGWGRGCCLWVDRGGDGGGHLQLVGGDGQRGGAAHGLQQAEGALLTQQGVHAELAQAHRPRERIA